MDELKEQIQEQLDQNETVTEELKNKVLMSGNIELISMLAKDKRYKDRIVVEVN